MAVKLQKNLWGEVGARHTGSTHSGWPGTKPTSDHPSAGLSMGGYMWGGPRTVASPEGLGFVCQWEAHGNVGTLVLFFSHNFTESQEDQLVNKKTHPVSNNDEKIHGTSKDLIRPEVILANQESREPGQVKGQEWPPTPNMLKLNRKLTNFVSNLEHGDHCKQVRPDDLKTKEVDTKGEKVGKVGWHGSGLEERCSGSRCQAHSEHQRAPKRPASNQSTIGLSTERASCCGTLVVASLEGSGCVLSVWVTGNVGM